MTIGKRIQAARKKRKMTQAKLGGCFGISAQAVSAWEREEGYPDLGKMPALAKALKVPIGWLIEGGGPVPDESDLAVQIEALSLGHQEAVAAYIQILVKGSGRAA